MKKKFSTEIDLFLAKSLKYRTNFDVVRRQIKIKRKNAVVYYLTSLISDVSVSSLMEGIESATTIKEINSSILNGNVYKETDFNKIYFEVANGVAALIIDSLDEVLLIDVRYYQTRSVGEPTNEQSIRGAKDGFVESLNINVGLIRRRIKSPSLTINNYIISKYSKTYVSLIYLDDIVDLRIVKVLKERLSSINIESLIMSDRALEEILFDQKFHPFPLVRYTERPDVASISLIKGKCLILVDNSSSVLIMPSILKDHTYNVEEFRVIPIVGTITRLLRNISIFGSVFIMPLWLSLVSDDGYTHGISINLEGVKFNTVVIQVLICEGIFEVLKMALIHTPNTLSGSIGLIAAVILSQVALDLGLFIPEIILLCAISTILQFATPSYELSLTNKFVKVLFIILVALFKKAGFIFGITGLFIYLTSIKVFNIPYLYPLCPLDIKKALNLFKRSSASKKNKL